MTLLQDKDVRTRKLHSCEWCGEAIPAGSCVNFRAYIFEGALNSGWQHLECNAAMHLYLGYDDDDGFDVGSFMRGTCTLKEEE